MPFVPVQTWFWIWWTVLGFSNAIFSKGVGFWSRMTLLKMTLFLRVLVIVLKDLTSAQTVWSAFKASPMPRHCGVSGLFLLGPGRDGQSH